jgi:putative DNA modification/repair radical SAM protein
MDVETKLAILGSAAKYDVSCASSGSKRGPQRGGLGTTAPGGICHSFTPDGRCISLLKILYTNICIYDCKYCVNRRSNDLPRACFTPGEVVDLTVGFYRRNYIEGLFLSSGIMRNADYIMERLNRVVRDLRKRHRFNGYVHLKIIPGASAELVTEAGLYADRVSANIELPTEPDLALLAPDKSLGDVDRAMGDIQARRRQAQEDSCRRHPSPRFAPAGQSTQMIVGATPTTDQQILATSSDLYTRHRLRRVYYSAINPTANPDALLSRIEAPPLTREHRLYQADWLMRYYGFEHEELTTTTERNLDLEQDPKLSWALRHREQFPVDVNTAPRERLLRVPGLGVRNVQRILSSRRHGRLCLEDLRRMRVALKRARYFIEVDGPNPALHRLDQTNLENQFQAPPHERQLLLFETKVQATTGEL